MTQERDEILYRRIQSSGRSLVKYAIRLQFLRTKSARPAYRTESDKTSELKVKSKLLSSSSWYRSRPFCPTTDLFSAHSMSLHLAKGGQSAYLAFSRVSEWFALT